MTVKISNENDMKRFGEKLGKMLIGGECIELIGDIGSGKTTMTKGIAKGMGVADTIQSPTFTVNRVYESPKGLQLSHYDFYRLADPGIMADELHETLADKNTAVVIEWGDVVKSVVPSERLCITFASPAADTRELTLSGVGIRISAIIEELNDFTA